MAADGVRVLGRIVGASSGKLTFATNANDVLDGADASFADFVAAARDFAMANPSMELEEEEPAESAALPAEFTEVETLDVQRENVAAIIWATGYEYDYHWLGVPVLDVEGRPVQQRGVSSVPGLYFLGLHWMHTYKSGLLSGVGSDAEYVAAHMDFVTGR
jgi:putative flavoprotein involved in K+ transport